MQLLDLTMMFPDAANEATFRAQMFHSTYSAHMIMFSLLCCTLTVGVADTAFGSTSLALLPMGLLELGGRHALHQLSDRQHAQRLGSNGFVVLSSIAWLIYLATSDCTRSNRCPGNLSACSGLPVGSA